MAEDAKGQHKNPGEPRRTGSTIGTARVDITRQAKKTLQAVLKSEDRSFQLIIDEPVARGGQSLGPSPLGYFVTGAASCLMMQYANVLKENPIPVEDIKMMARGHHDRATRVFTDMIYEISLTGPVSPEDAEALARAASARCFVENTLAKAMPITTEVRLNGKKIATLTRSS